MHFFSELLVSAPNRVRVPFPFFNTDMDVFFETIGAMYGFCFIGLEFQYSLKISFFASKGIELLRPPPSEGKKEPECTLKKEPAHIYRRMRVRASNT